MEMGISSDDFWEMSVSDARDEITARFEANKHRQQQMSAQAYNIALLTGLAVNDVFSGKRRFPSSLSAAFPSLFEDAENVEALDWRENKAYMEQLKKVHNKKMKGGEPV